MRYCVFVNLLFCLLGYISSRSYLMTLQCLSLCMAMSFFILEIFDYNPQMASAWLRVLGRRYVLVLARYVLHHTEAMYMQLLF